MKTQMNSMVLAVTFALAMTLIAGPANAEEWNIDFYGGPAYELDEDDPGELTIGGRIGQFFPVVGQVDVGLFVDSSAIFDDNDPDPTDFIFVPTSALAFARVRAYEGYGMDLHPYIGVGPSVVWSELDTKAEDDSQVDIGLDARGGLRAILLDRFALFVEYRLNYFQADFDIPGPVADVDSTYHSALFGLGYRFGSDL